MKRILSIVLALALLLTALPLALSVSAAETAVATFELGANGSATHKDGTKDLATYSENNNNYSLSITGASKFYPNSIDSKGNGCIKLGSKSAAGKFTFTVPGDITKVVIKIASYNTDSSCKVSVNSGTTQTISTKSSNGAYTDVVIDTSSTKTINFTTVSGGFRAMMNTIIFYKEVAGACEHTSTHVEKDDATNHKYVCDDCGNTAKTEGHDFKSIGTDPASCTKTGTETYECSICGETKVEVLGLEPHKYENGKCTVCGNSDIIFEFGENGAASHSDGSELKEDTSYEVSNFTLTLTDLTKVYGNARDALGNSCLKLGTKDTAGKISFVVPDNVVKVLINVAGYKDNTAKVSVNSGEAQEIKTFSDNGEYTALEIDTSSNKSVTFTTASGGYRAMVNSIAYVVGEVTECTHANTTTTNTATYFKDGKVTVYCEDCKTTVSETDADPITDTPVKFDTPILNPETNELTVAWTYSEALNEDIKAAATKGLAVKFAFGDKEYTVPNTVLNTEGGSVTIEGINADRFNKTFSLNLEFTVDTYDTTTLNSVAVLNNVVLGDVIDSNNAKVDEYTALIDAIKTADSAVVEGAGTGSDDFTAGASSVDIKAGTATFKFVATQDFVDKVTENGKANRTVKLVVTVDGEEHEVTINQLKTSIKVTIKGLSFEQMYGSVSAKLVITYSDDSSKNIDSQAVTFNFEDSIKNSDNTVAVALEALLKN